MSFERFRSMPHAAALLCVGGLLLPACESAPTAPARCRTAADCPAGRVCVANRCVAESTVDTGGGGLDSGTPPVDAPATDGGGMPGDDTGGGETDAGPVDAGLIDPGSPDEDMDGISDLHEGRALMADTDGDGIEDYRDIDSDGDGIFDDAEAGDSMVATPPVDTDGDGLPDFRDLDSDGNGVLDRLEGGGDVDADGRPNFRDLDNDGDGLLDREEVGPDAMVPADSDGDGTPDMNERDSDADTISDTEEDVFDTDTDGRLDRTDTDSDGDGWNDSVEAGDADLMTPAVDTDADGTADYRDPDSDDDGLSDAAERTAGTSRTSADTDGDGVSDLIEIGAGTRATDPTDSPRTRGDFVFLEPYMMAPSPTRDTLQFSTDLQRADVYFLMDNTGSMGGTIAALQAGLTSTVIPAIVTDIPEAWFGVGGFDDYPVTGIYENYGLFPCGTTGYGTNAPDSAGIRHDVPFFQYQIMTPTSAIAQAAVNRYQVNCGEDVAEAGVAALYALASRDTLGGRARYATGAASSAAVPTCPAGYRGAACFRPDAVPIVIVMTDVDQHNSPSCNPAAWGGIEPCAYSTIAGTPSYAATVASLGTLNARVVGIETDDYDGNGVVDGYARPFLTRVVQDATIARGAPGVPMDYIYSAPLGAGLSAAITTLVRRAADVPLDVSAQAIDLVDAGETVNAVTAFVDHLETRTSAAPGLTCTTGFVTADRAGIDADSFPDTFNDVTPGSPVCFDIIPRMNTTVMPTLVPQIFRAQINVIGDGFTPLDDRIVYFLVPPRIPDPGS